MITPLLGGSTLSSASGRPEGLIFLLITFSANGKGTTIFSYPHHADFAVVADCAIHRGTTRVGVLRGLSS